jgi:aspartate aminotransferase
MFEVLPSLLPDPILGLVAAYRADPNPLKVDLGAGVYKDEQGNTPIMDAVRQAQLRWLEQESTKVYAPPAGFAGFNEGIIGLLLGSDHKVVTEKRVASVQTPGGSGALRVAAGLLSRCQTQVKIWVSGPTWANHIPVMRSAGLVVAEYPYYNYLTHAIDFDAMISTLSTVSAGDLVLLHGCCHNPSGADLSHKQWQVLAELLLERGATPFVDVAYQGLGDGLDEDVWGLRYLADKCPELMIATSCSKNFGLYRERVGAVVAVAKDSATAAVCSGQLLNVARELYSMPPSHGAALVDLILHDTALTQVWQQELNTVRERIAGLREAFVQRLHAAGAGDRFDYIRREKGMFSFLGISPEQVQALKEKKSIYMVSSSRINIAGLNNSNMDYVTDSLMALL